MSYMEFEVTVRLRAGSLAEATSRMESLVVDVPELLYYQRAGEPLGETWATVRKNASSARAGNANIISAKAVKESK